MRLSPSAIVTLWGTRGSVASPGPETSRYGGNTPCVEVRGAGRGTLLILDAGTGIRRLGASLGDSPTRIDILLTHLHLDHIQGLGFFAPLYDPRREVHIWGPASLRDDLRTRLTRYLSPPLFPVHLRDLPSRLVLHDLAGGEFEIGEFQMSCSYVCHPGPTLGYRITAAGAALAYLPDHEPALGARTFPLSCEWTSGCHLASNVDLLIHDAQYRTDEYQSHLGWGHSALPHAFRFAAVAGARHLVPFHHDPTHSDDDIDRAIEETTRAERPSFRVTPGWEGATFELRHGNVR